MSKFLRWWIKHSLVIAAVTFLFYGLARLEILLEARQFPLKILMMLCVIAATPVGAAAGWLFLKFFSLLLLPIQKMRGH